MTVCMHLNMTALGSTRCTTFKHCPTCGWESEPAGHVWVPAGLDPEDALVCARCAIER